MTSKIFVYEGKERDVTWDGRLCIHVGECGRSDGELFIGGRKPWCQPDLSSDDEVHEVVKRCPTGALTVRQKDGSTDTEVAEPNRIMVANRGPLYFTGDLTIEGASDDMNGTQRRAALCRCGKSKNKPFCDNAHEASGFDDRGSVGSKGSGLKDAANGALEVNKAPNGPLLLSGPLTILSANGRVAHQSNGAALCRCGESKNKPFCDGAHAAAGFEAE